MPLDGCLPFRFLLCMPLCTPGVSSSCVLYLVSWFRSGACILPCLHRGVPCHTSQWYKSQLWIRCTLRRWGILYAHPESSLWESPWLCHCGMYNLRRNILACMYTMTTPSGFPRRCRSRVQSCISLVCWGRNLRDNGNSALAPFSSTTTAS